MKIRLTAHAVQAVLVGALLVSMTGAVMAPHLAFAGSPDVTTPENGTQNQEQKLTEQNQATLDKNQPAPTFTHSTERDNLIKRLNLTANPNQVGYIYLLGANGQVIANYVVKGKVSSLNSYLTTTSQIQACSTGQYGGSCVATESPDLDGSYGSNPEGVFFFTSTGTYVEWSGPYMYSNQPMNITTPVTLVEQAH